MLNSKIPGAEVYTNFQDGCRRHVRNSSACYKMGNYHPSSMKIVTQTKTGMLSSKMTKAEAYGKKTAKLKCKKMISF
jgi:hypothetical protein